MFGDVLMRPGCHRIFVDLEEAPSHWSTTIFGSALPIAGMNEARSPRPTPGNPCALELVIDIGDRARALADVREWLWDSLTAADLRPILLTFTMRRFVARPSPFCRRQPSKTA